MYYKPITEYQPGKMTVISDTFSQSTTAYKETESSQTEEDADFHVNMVTSSWPILDEKLNQVRQETQEYKSLKAMLDNTV